MGFLIANLAASSLMKSSVRLRRTAYASVTDLFTFCEAVFIYYHHSGERVSNIFSCRPAKGL
jgi:hypothetical protein